MRERAQKIGAQFNIWSHSGAGTEIELTVSAKVAYPHVAPKFPRAAAQTRIESKWRKETNVTERSRCCFWKIVHSCPKRSAAGITGEQDIEFVDESNEGPRRAVGRSAVLHASIK